MESSGIQLYAGGWTRATAQNAPLSSAPPSGAAFDCPSLRFSVRSADDDWAAANA